MINTKQIIVAATLLNALFISGCNSFIAQAGPDAADIVSRVADTDKAKLVEVDELLIGQLASEANQTTLLTAHWIVPKPALTLQEGDSVQISIWEAPPAVLFGSGGGAGAADMSLGSNASVLNLPEQMIAEKGTLVVPFAGEVPAAGRTLSQIESAIRTKLAKIANQPQVIARLTQNATNVATVVVDGLTRKLLLTAKGERLLDTLPLVADIKKVKGALIAVERGGVSHKVSVDRLTKNPKENFYILPSDVITVLNDPYSATVLGASNTNASLNFGEDGMSVAEAIGRVSGLNGYRADPKGVFVFRPVKLASLPVAGQPSQQAVDTLPTVYRLDMSSAKGVFLAQGFKLQNKDTVYISDSQSVGLQKVLGIIGSVVSAGRLQ